MKLCHFTAGLDQPFFLIAGPCVIESLEMAIETAGQLKDITTSLGIPFIYKSSFDKANRSSGSSFRGLGMEKGLAILAEVRKQIGVPVLTDIHEIDEIKPVAAVVDVLQTPAFLCRQTDFIRACAQSGKPVNIKTKRARPHVKPICPPMCSWLASVAYPLATTIWCPTCDRWPSCAIPIARWCLTQRTRCSFRAVRAQARVGSVNSCRYWRVRRLRLALPACSWKRTPIRPMQNPTARMRYLCIACVNC
jgi:hypothetical protein